MEVCSRRSVRIGRLAESVLRGVSVVRVHGRRTFHDYWTQKAATGQSLRIPILKAHHHLGALSSRGDRAENEDRLKVGVMNKIGATDEQQPFYFAIIDGYPSQLEFPDL
jgi:hypothetical protein